MILVTLADKPVLMPQVPDPGVNWFASGTGAGRYGHGLFLLAAADYDAIVPSSGTGTVKLVMQDQRGAAGKLSVDVLVASAMPYVGKGDGASLTGVVAVQVYDKRYGKDASLTKVINLQKSGFSHNGSDQPEFVPASLSGSSEYGWADAVTSLEGVPTLPTAPTWKPRNVVISGWQLHRVVDWIAANLFLVVGWDDASAAYKYHDPGVMTDANRSLLDGAKGLIVGGGVGKRNTKRLPKSFGVTFTSRNLSDPTAIAQADYVKSVTTAGDGSIQPLHVGSYVAAYKGSSTLNTSTLDGVATDLAARAYKFISVSPAAYTFKGIVPFVPDGAIRDVLWSTSAAGATTRMMQGVRFDWAAAANGGLWGYADPAMPGAMPRLEFPSDQLVTGIAGSGTSIDPAGTIRVWPGPADGSCVLVKITANGSGGGVYAGELHANGLDPTDGNLDLPEGLEAGDAVTVYYAPEDGKPTHRLKVGAYAVGKVVGQDADGVTVVVVSSGECRRASPEIIVGEGKDANGVSWDRDTVTSGDAKGDEPVSLDVQTRTFWDPTANQLMYFKRRITWDAGGLLASISAESMVVVDTATDDPCPEDMDGGEG